MVCPFYNRETEGGGGVLLKFVELNQSINQLYLNTVNGSASWFSDMPCDKLWNGIPFDKLWNGIPFDMRKKDTAGAFKNTLKKYFLA